MTPRRNQGICLWSMSPLCGTLGRLLSPGLAHTLLSARNALPSLHCLADSTRRMRFSSSKKFQAHPVPFYGTSDFIQHTPHRGKRGFPCLSHLIPRGTRGLTGLCGMMLQRPSPRPGPPRAVHMCSNLILPTAPKVAMINPHFSARESAQSRDLTPDSSGREGCVPPPWTTWSGHSPAGQRGRTASLGTFSVQFLIPGPPPSVQTPTSAPYRRRCRSHGHFSILR